LGEIKGYMAHIAILLKHQHQHQLKNVLGRNPHV
jgi:hypothetical protein